MRHNPLPSAIGGAHPARGRRVGPRPSQHRGRNALSPPCGLYPDAHVSAARIGRRPRVQLGLHPRYPLPTARRGGLSPPSTPRASRRTKAALNAFAITSEGHLTPAAPTDHARPLAPLFRHASGAGCLPPVRHVDRGTTATVVQVRRKVAVLALRTKNRDGAGSRVITRGSSTWSAGPSEPSPQTPTRGGLVARPHAVWLGTRRTP